LTRSTLRVLLISGLLAGLWACGPKGAKLQKSVVPPDKTLFETGSEYLQKSQYIKARLAFQTLINTYPDSELSADSYLAIGDSFYDEGGTENLLQAEDQYKNFIVFFPTNPKAADAQMKIISLNMKMMRAPDRDSSYSVKAHGAIRRMIEQFPDSDYVPIAKEYLKEVEENLAMGNFGVGNFYSERGNFPGATSRYKEVVENYPDFSLLDEAYFRLGDALEKSKNPDEAAIYYGRIAQQFPKSRYFDESKNRLKTMEKPIPAVDEKMAVLHEPKPKVGEGFSPLKPFVNFVEALGFKGPPDRYEEAKRTIETKKAEVLAAEAAKGAESGKSGGDILIETTLRKDASGKTQESTVLGAGSNPVSANTSGSKKNSKSTKKKNDKKS
jgi:outer membrane assembly lipoprotein YfiO